MDYKNLLEIQKKKNLSDQLLSDPHVQSFLKDIEDTYFAFDKEKDLLTRAYKMAENEYVEINNHLNEEIKNRKETISFLKSSISKFSSKNENIVSENLIDFSTLIVEEIEKRQKAEETLKVLINNLNMGIILKDASGKIIYVNTSVYDIFKIENDSENDYSSLLEKIGILRSRSLKSSQLKRQYRNNIYGSQYVTEIWSYEESRLIEEVMIPYLYGNNERGFIFTFSDVTERERSNELIRISELRYNQILKGFPDAVILINANGKIKFSNKRTTEIFGWNSNEIIDQDIRLLIPFEGFLTVKNTIENAIQIDDLLNNIAELKITDRFGKELWIEYSFVRMEEIHETSYCCFVRDSTNRKLAENEIKKQKKFTEDILNNIPNDIAVYDINQQYLFLNEKYVEDHDERNSLIGRSDFEYCTFKNLDSSIALKRRDAFDKVVLEHIDVEWIDEYVSNNGGNKQYYQRKFHPYKEDGEIKFVIGYGIDITTNIQNQKVLEQSLDYAKKVNSDLEQFAYVASHDLQEPLRTITNFLSLIERRLQDNLDEKTKSYLKYSVDAAKRLRVLILDLLEYSRIGKSEENKIESVNLNELIAEISIMHSSQIQEFNASLIYHDLPVIRIQKSLIRQIFQNFISNGLKYHFSHRPPVIKIECLELDRYWQFSIEDNGIGIESQYFEKIFVIFQRLYTKEQYSGTGIGLAITKKLIESLGGEVWLTSEKDKGSVFYFTVLKNL